MVASSPSAPQTADANHVPSPRGHPALQPPLAGSGGVAESLGARQEAPYSASWDLHRPQWSARIDLEVEELKVCWHQEGSQSVRLFPYGLSRADAEAAILAGP